MEQTIPYPALVAIGRWLNPDFHADDREAPTPEDHETFRQVLQINAALAAGGFEIRKRDCGCVSNK